MKKLTMLLVIASVAVLLSIPCLAYAADAESCSTAAASAGVCAQSKNDKAHAAYRKVLKKRAAEDGAQNVRYRFVDLDRDGVDEMIVAWFPTVYGYVGGKAKIVDRAMTGTSSYSIAPNAKVLCRVEPDHVGSAHYRYFKKAGGKFVMVASLYTHDPRDTYYGDISSYWVKGKGDVSKKVATRYVKKLLGGHKLKFVKMKRYAGK